MLLEKGANVNYQARHNITPLHVCSKWGRANMVSLLLAHGAVIDCRTRDLLTPLHCAARSGQDNVTSKNIPVDIKYSFVGNRTPPRERRTNQCEDEERSGTIAHGRTR